MDLNLDGLISLIGQVVDVPGENGLRTVGKLTAVMYHDQIQDVELRVGGKRISVMPGSALSVTASPVSLNGAHRVFTPA